MDGSDDETSGPGEAEASLPVQYLGQQSDERDHQGDSAAAGAHERHWRPTLNRWLLTLNPGRTQDEYEKAIRYFFETPGVPQDLTKLTTDLLLAYRGSLALRADRRRRSMPRRAAAFTDQLDARRDGPWAASAVAGAAGAQTHEGAGRRTFASASQRIGPLSPATVNIRLTALRQFMLYAIEQEWVPTLTADRVRSALRRLRNERRRPYQILAEEEWSEFLDAALAPAAQATAAAPSTPGAPASAPTSGPPAAESATTMRGPWGMTRAEREQARQRLAAAELAPAAATPPDAPADEPDAAPAHAIRGRTGAHTAQRDHALISLALATGLRAIELSLLDVGDLVSERRRGQTEWWLSLPDEKTKGQRGGRTLPLAPELMATLLAYIRATGRSWDDPAQRATPLFLALARGRSPHADLLASQALALAAEEQDQRERRLRPEQIRSVIHRVEAQWQAQRRAATDDSAGATGDARHISPHALRHSAAIALLLGDEASERPPASVEHVRGWLGHFDIRTTQRYLAHIESRDHRRRFAIRPQTRTGASSAANSASPADGEQHS